MRGRQRGISLPFLLMPEPMCVCVCVCVCYAQLCPSLCEPMDCRLLGSSAHGILQARILEWVAIPFSRGSSQPRDQTLVCIAGRFFTICYREVKLFNLKYTKYTYKLRSQDFHFQENKMHVLSLFLLLLSV